MLDVPLRLKKSTQQSTVAEHARGVYALARLVAAKHPGAAERSPHGYCTKAVGPRSNAMAEGTTTTKKGI